MNKKGGVRDVKWMRKRDSRVEIKLTIWCSPGAAANLFPGQAHLAHGLRLAVDRLPGAVQTGTSGAWLKPHPDCAKPQKECSENVHFYFPLSKTEHNVPKHLI